jgi:hypothetical protein
MKKIVCSSIIVCMLFVWGCQQANPPSSNGCDWNYLLDTKQLIQNIIADHAKDIKSFVEVTKKSNGKIDSAYLRGTMVDWKFYTAAMEDINLYNKVYHRNYSMAQYIDTIQQSVSIQYDPLYTNLAVTKMIVNMETETQNIKSVYATYAKKKAFSEEKKSIVYTAGECLQIVSEAKEGKEAKELYFIKDKTPTVTIVQ